MWALNPGPLLRPPSGNFHSVFDNLATDDRYIMDEVSTGRLVASTSPSVRRNPNCTSQESFASLWISPHLKDSASMMEFLHPSARWSMCLSTKQHAWWPHVVEVC